jgi:uncharacterized protein with FMN-binding domain
MNETKKISIPLLIGGLVLVIAIGIGGVSIYISNQSNNTNKPDIQTPGIQTPINSSIVPTPIPAIPQSSNADLNSTYKNGTYTASGSYTSPGGRETIDVALTIANDTVTAVNVTPHPDNPTTSQYQNRFKNGVSGRIVGKKVDNAKISISDGNVNGSSLTLRGFNQALELIKSQAKI